MREPARWWPPRSGSLPRGRPATSQTAVSSIRTRRIRSPSRALRSSPPAPSGSRPTRACTCSPTEAAASGARPASPATYQAPAHKKRGARTPPFCRTADLDRQRLQVDRLLFEDPGGLLALLLVVVEPGPGGDELADDDVLLEPAQTVHLAADRGLGEHAGGLLERRRRKPRGGVQGGLDEPEQHGLGGGRLAALRQSFRVALLVLPLRDDLAREQAGVAGRVDADLPHHLPHDHLDVLVVDVHALAAVDLLDLVDQERLDRLFAEDVEQLLR